MPCEQYMHSSGSSDGCCVGGPQSQQDLPLHSGISLPLHMASMTIRQGVATTSTIETKELSPGSMPFASSLIPSTRWDSSLFLTTTPSASNSQIFMEMQLLYHTWMFTTTIHITDTICINTNTYSEVIQNFNTKDFEIKYYF